MTLIMKMNFNLNAFMKEAIFLFLLIKLKDTISQLPQVPKAN